MGRTQDQRDVLAQPTRAGLFRLLARLKRPASTAELAQELDLHPNGVRVHLERLHQAGLVTRERPATRRGRPRDEWAVTPGAVSPGDRSRAYRDLASWLSRSISSHPGRLREVEDAGRDIGRALAPAVGGPPAALVENTLAGLGFQPEVSESGAALTCVLRHCPYRDAVRANREVVCGLHRGITRGLLDVIDPAARLEAFVARDPDIAGCLIEIEGLSER